MKNLRLISSVVLAAMLLAGCRRDEIPKPIPAPPTPETPEDPDPGTEDETGSGTVPCILIEFKDIRFEDKEAVSYFEGVLNGEGSVRQYYMDNSLGVFVPEFDVYGPVTLDKYRAYYGSDVIVDGARADAGADKALEEACRKLDPKVDFGRYDKDGDGVVDVVMFVFAGHDQAQGGPFEAIWSHQWYLKNFTMDGVKLDKYFCGPQYRGKEGKERSGPGIFIHEYAHALGLPDLYGKSGKDLGNLSVMCQGLFNEDGFTPPYFNAQERMMLGWMQSENLLEFQEGWQVIPSIKNNTAYIIRTETDGEYFIVEYRDSRDWDRPIPAGLAVYHIDRSAPYISRWDKWRDPGMGINDLDSHPCFYLAQAVFPGLSHNAACEPVCWDGTPSACQLTNIGLTDQGIGVYVQYNCGANVNGYVRNTYGDPVAGASVLLDQEETQTDADGHFFIEEPPEGSGVYNLTVSAAGYMDYRAEVSMDVERVVSVPVTMRREDEGEEFTLSKYDGSLARGYYSKAGIGAVRFTPEDLEPYKGGLLKEVVFYPFLKNSFDGEIYVTVDVGTERVLTKKVETLSFGSYFRNSIDIAEEGIVVPDNEDLYVGYGSSSSGDGSFYLGTVYPGTVGNSFWSPFGTESSSWRSMYVERAGIYMDLALELAVVKSTTDNKEEPEEE